MAALAALLVVDFLTIPVNGKSRSHVKSVVLGATHEDAATSTRFRNALAGHFERRDGDLGFYWMPPFPHNAVFADTEFYQTQAYVDGPRTTGLYHPTRYNCELSFRNPFADEKDPPTNEMEMALLAASRNAPEWANWSRRDLDLHLLIEMLESGEYSREHALPAGYIRSLLAALTLTLLVYCTIRGRPDLWVARWLDAFRTRRLPPNHCPTCHYDATGLSRCPECGSDVAPTTPV
ncbi:MAG: hypothetical protein AAFX79_05105 [Planctomycetota bacterium]